MLFRTVSCLAALAPGWAACMLVLACRSCVDQGSHAEVPEDMRGGFQVHGLLRQAVDGMVSIRFDAPEGEVADTVPFHEGEFFLAGRLSEPGFVRIGVMALGDTLETDLFLTNGEHVRLDVDRSGPVQFLVSGSRADQDHDAYMRQLSPVLERMAQVDSLYAIALKEGDEAQVERLDEHVKKIRQERQRLAKRFVEQQPSSPVAVYALVTSFGAAPDPDLLAAALDALAPEWQQVHDARYLREEILAPAEKLRVGNLAPPIRMSAGRSDLIYSPEIMGRYVLIDFWASWCGPCRLANRQFVPIYQEFAPLGFTILGISLDRDTMAWHKAAMQDGVTWFDLCDGKGFGTRPAKDYGVKAVPFNVLVDPDGRILARDLKGPALRRWLSRELTRGLDQ